jgi:hypothetical protein
MGNRTRDLPGCSILPQPTTLTRAPSLRYRSKIKLLFGILKNNEILEHVFWVTNSEQGTVLLLHWFLLNTKPDNVPYEVILNQYRFKSRNTVCFQYVLILPVQWMIAFQHSATLKLYPSERTLPVVDEFSSFHSELTGTYLTHLTRIAELSDSHSGCCPANSDIPRHLSAPTGKYDGSILILAPHSFIHGTASTNYRRNLKSRH